MTALQDFAIILAAGASSRMGTCKTALPWQGSTLLAYQCEQFLLTSVTPIVVLGPHNLHRQDDCPQESYVVLNAAPKRGKISSIQTGLNALPADWTTLFIAAVDQPRPVNVYRTLLQTHRERTALLTAPSYHGKLGHPLVFSNRLASELAILSEETLGLRRIVQNLGEAIAKVEFTTPLILSDLNTPAHYQEHLRTVTVKR
ncbi:nucleotidyltransferase family protein [Oscillatoria sp. CS-180]|uniref:nucleotidyltransferase family protein n=1 Tax=Oscillatoria sp. CS-180 TaxID=3021720 RepID=UPI00232E840C|nr:nucleotidyltransferase family protein [Oscillatoria sp. CS-180]MDB9525823.1 nucleotidyltransferase family protein [Oscillatoria sp. CS-180]